MLSFQERQIGFIGYQDHVLSVIKNPIIEAVTNAEATALTTASNIKDRKKRLASWGSNAYFQLQVELERELTPCVEEVRPEYIHDQQGLLIKDPAFPTPFHMMALRGKRGRNCMKMNPMGPWQENHTKKNAYLMGMRSVWGDDKPPIADDDYPILWLISEILKGENACIHLLLAWHMNRKRTKFDYMDCSTFHFYSVVGYKVEPELPQGQEPEMDFGFREDMTG